MSKKNAGGRGHKTRGIFLTCANRTMKKPSNQSRDAAQGKKKMK